MNSRRTLSQIALVTGVLLFSAGLQTLAAFTAPTTAPPGADAYAPLHTGSDAQSKVGGLLLNTGGAVNGLIVQSGNVGIGTASPSQKLQVTGNAQISGSVIQGGGISLYSCSASYSSSGCAEIPGGVTVCIPSSYSDSYVSTSNTGGCTYLGKLTQ